MKWIKLAILILSIFQFSCKINDEIVPDFLDYKIEVGSIEGSSFSAVLEDSTLLYYGSLNDSLMHLFLPQAPTLGVLEMDINGDKKSELLLKSMVIRNEKAGSASGNYADGGPYQYYYKLTIEKLDDNSWWIAKDGSYIRRFTNGELVNLAELEYEKNISESVISFGSRLWLPIEATSKTGGWWNAENNSLILICMNEKTAYASVICISVQHYNSAVVHSIMTYKLDI
jgi:hypothetical protein